MPLDEGVISAFRYMYETSVSGSNTEGNTYAAISASEDGETSTALVFVDTDYTDEDYGIRKALVLAPKTGWGTNPYIQAELSTKGYKDIAVSAKIGATKKGPAEYMLQYSIDGESFIDVASYTLASNKTLYKAFDKEVLGAEADGLDRLYIRIVPVGTATVGGGVLSGTSGEYAVNDILIYGTATGEATPEPTEIPESTEEPEVTEEPQGDGIIHLLGNSIDAAGVVGVTVDGTTATITAAGEYTVEGTLDDGQLLVAAANKSDAVTVRLNGVSIASSTGDAFSASMGEVTLAAAEGKENTFKASADSACGIYSKNDLIIKGDGKITAISELGNGIRSKADIEIGAGDIEVNAYNNGIKGDESVKFTKKATNVNITAKTGDAIKTDAIDTDTGILESGKGGVVINGGTLTLTAAEGDGIQADDSCAIAGGDITVNAGANGIKANSIDVPSTDAEGIEITVTGSLTISGGTVNVTSVEECLRAAGKLDITGGDITVAATGAAQDAVKAGKTEDTVSGSTTTTVVTSKGAITISGGSLNITSAPDDAVVSSGTFTMTDGVLRGNSTCDFMKIYDSVDISGGTVDIVSGLDGIQSGKALTVTGTTESDYTVGNLTISGGIVNVKANGGSTKRSHTTVSALADSCKGIKANTYLKVTGGELNISSCDDAIHSNWETDITGGTLNLASDDDGIHADYMLVLGTEGGIDEDFTVDISYSYEGIEGSVIKVLSGTTYLYSTDDGANAAGDYEEGAVPSEAALSEADGEAQLMAGPGNWGGGTGNMGPGGGNDDSSAHGMLYIKGGRLYCEVNGDGLDSNGNIEMSGGVAIVNGPTSGGNGVFDKGDNNNHFYLTGGTLIGVGTSDMLDNPSQVTGQGYYSNSSASITKGTAIKLAVGSGYIAIVPKVTLSRGLVYISSPEMSSGQSYSITTGTVTDGAQVFGKTESGIFYGLVKK